MNRILPFKGWRYQLDRVGAASKVIAPPYDVIDDDLLAKLQALSPYNSARLILPTAGDGGGPKSEDKYETAGRLFRAWRANGVLAPGKAPAYYYTRQTFTGPTGEKFMRSGFLGLFGITDDAEESGAIKGHERTLDGPKADRFKIFQSTNANLSPVFSVYSDPQGMIDAIMEAEANRRQPDITGEDHLGVINEVWILDQPAQVRTIFSAMADKALLIADGHHRFETAKNYRSWLRQQGRWSADAGCNAVMMYFANLDQPGLKIFPIHRVIHGMPQLSWDRFRDQLGAHFNLIDLPSGNDWRPALDRLGVGGGSSRPAFVVAMKPNRWMMAELLPTADLNALLAETPAPLRPLEVIILHKLVFEKMLGMTVEDQAQKRYLDYHANPDRILEMLTGADTQAALFIRALTGKQVQGVALAGEKMPQKSTYFYPKILTGFVFNDLGEPISNPA